MTTHDMAQPPTLSRLVAAEDVPANGLDVTVEANEAERGALARDLGLAELARLVGHFTVAGTPRRLKVSGRVEASLTQTCVVTLEPFDSELSEDVDVVFAEPQHGGGAERGKQAEKAAAKHAGDAGDDGPPRSGASQDPPDDIVDGLVDLGALTAEFLCLGLDPYPRKPGVTFDPGLAPAAPESPFAALAKLKP